MTLTISIFIVNLGFIIDHIDSIEYNSKEKLNNPCIFNSQSYQCALPDGKTPYEMLYNRKPYLKDLHEWGTTVWVHDTYII